MIKCIITTISGRKVDLLDPQPEVINIGDIAWSLSKQARFNGHTSRLYSVAEHCFYGALSNAENAAISLAFLLHDASEAYLGDLIGPLKLLPGFEKYRELEKRFQDVIEKKYGLTQFQNYHEEIKAIDTRMLETEKKALNHRATWETGYDAYDVNLFPLPLGGRLHFQELFLTLTKSLKTGDFSKEVQSEF